MRVETQQDYWAAKPRLSRENEDLYGIEEGSAKRNVVFF